VSALTSSYLPLSLDDAPCGYLALDDAGVVQAMNATLVQLLGGTREQWVGGSVRELLTPASRLFVETHLLPLVALQGGVEGAFLTVRAVDGERLPMLLNARRVAGDETPARIDCILFLVRRRESYEAELREAREQAEKALEEKTAALATLEHERRQLAMVFEAAPTFMAVLRYDDLAVELANPAFRRLVGGRDTVGRPLADVVPELTTADFAGRLDAVRDQQTPFVGKELCLALNGATDAAEQRFVDIVFFPLTDAAGHPAGVFVHGVDITEERRLRDQMRHAQRMEVAGRFAGGIAHDFNNLLAAIQGSTELLLMNVPDHDPRHTHLDVIMLACARGRTLTGQLLAFTRQAIERARPLEVDDVIDRALPLIRSLIGARISIERRSSARRPRIVMDPLLLELSIMNLAANARDAMEHGGVLTLESAVHELSADEALRRGLSAGEWVSLRVGDSGHGVPPEVRSRIFEPFFTTKPVGKGTGLGLSTVWGIVTQAGGSIECDSTVDVGTDFTMWFPALPEPEEVKSSVVHPSRAHIVVVDDEAAVLQLVSEFLELLGHTVEKFALPMDALERMSDEDRPRVDLLITDYRMPGMLGDQLAACLREVSPELPIIVLTGFTDANASILAELKNTTILAKPFALAQLRQCVDNALR
jgi:signal transduction histidine kinase/CheY-like chemotaxis protein